MWGYDAGDGAEVFGTSETNLPAQFPLDRAILKPLPAGEGARATQALPTRFLAAPNGDAGLTGHVEAPRCPSVARCEPDVSSVSPFHSVTSSYCHWLSRPDCLHGRR